MGVTGPTMGEVNYECIFLPKPGAYIYIYMYVYLYIYVYNHRKLSVRMICELMESTNVSLCPIRHDPFSQRLGS